MSILFISSLVPDTPKYWNPAFTRSGQNVMMGIADALSKNSDVELISCKPVPSFPRGPLWVKSSYEVTSKGHPIYFLPTLNILFLKNVVWGLSAYIYISKWARLHKNKSSRNILVYNIYIPIISILYKAARVTKSKLFAILYDLGIPPAHLGLSKLRIWGYKYFERLAYKYIPRLDGRIVINERITEEYALGKDSILIDGGVSESLISKLFPLKLSAEAKVTYVLAGMLWEQNGTTLLLEALQLRPNLDIRVIFAGNGNDVPKILEVAKVDNRIQYLGVLSMDELLKVYQDADVLLNLRIEEENDMHFPSKLLEYMSMGKWVVSTPIAHSERDYTGYLDFLYEITPSALAEKMDQIALKTKSELLYMGIRTRAFILENRNWNRRTLEILNYINSKN